MAPGKHSPASLVHRAVITATLLSVACLRLSSAQDYATNLNVSAAQTTSATLTWSAASNATATSYLVAVLVGSTSLVNYTISDVATETYTITDLSFSTYYTVNVYTLDGADQTTGVSTVSFWTAYMAINPKFISALGVLGFIILTLVVMMALKSKFLAEDKKMDKQPVLKKEDDIDDSSGGKKTKQDVEKGAGDDILIF